MKKIESEFDNPSSAMEASHGLIIPKRQQEISHS